MTILVTGGTGTIGSQVVGQLARRGADVRALVRDPAAAKLPEGVAAVRGDLLDVDAIRMALDGVTTLDLLNAVAPDEFTQALITLNLAREAGIDRLVYFPDLPLVAAFETGFHATILRPDYFINNDLSIKDVVIDHGVYPMPVGDKGLAMADVRDIGEVAALELLRR